MINCFHSVIAKNELIEINQSKQIVIKCKEKTSDIEILRSNQQTPRTESDGEILASFQIEYDQKGDSTLLVFTYFDSNSQKKRILKEIYY